MRLLLTLSLGALTVSLTPSRVAAQDTVAEWLTQATLLNRSGRWEEAAEVAARAAVAPGASVLQRCEAYASAFYAKLRVSRRDEAAATLAEFDRACSGLSTDHWIRALVSRYRTELSGAPTQTARETRLIDDAFWRVADPEEFGLDTTVLRQHRDLCGTSGADGCLVVYRGVIVQEWYSRRYKEPIHAMSSTKSVTGLLTGMLIGDGRIDGLDQRVCDFVVEWCAGQKREVRLRHLLSMTAGLRRMYADGVGYTTNKDSLSIAARIDYTPGTHWEYSNEGVQLLSPVLDRAAGEPVQEYARRRLFDPLGMRSTRLKVDERGHAWTYADMETTLRDFARIGVLMMNNGSWQGTTILHPDWVRASTAPSQPLNPRYGLLWWLYEEPKGFAALGYLDTNLYVFPSLDLVVARMQAAPMPNSRPYETPALSLFKRLVQRPDDS